MNSALEPSTAEQALAELKAVREGYGPLQEELAERLGKYSLAATEMDDAQRELAIGKANLAFVRQFADLLPQSQFYDVREHTTRSKFVVRGTNPQYTARQIQANTLWNRSSIESREFTVPYYIIGEEDKAQSSKSTKLMLLPAWRTATGIIIAPVRSDDLSARGQLVTRLQEEYTAEERAEMLNRSGGYYEVKPELRGCILLGAFGLGKFSAEDVAKRGIRRAKKEFPSDHVEIRSDMMEDFRVLSHIAKLAEAFSVEEGLRALIEKGEPEVLPEGRHKWAVVEQIAEQNNALKEALCGALFSTGLLDEDSVRKLIEEKYPTIEL